MPVGGFQADCFEEEEGIFRMDVETVLDMRAAQENAAPVAVAAPVAQEAAAPVMEQQQQEEQEEQAAPMPAMTEFTVVELRKQLKALGIEVKGLKLKKDFYKKLQENWC
jgi:hypothetical protein